MADQSTPSEKAARHVILLLSAKGQPDNFFSLAFDPLFEPHLRRPGHQRISSHRRGRVNVAKSTISESMPTIALRDQGVPDTPLAEKPLVPKPGAAGKGRNLRIIRISASVGAMPRSLCRPRRSRDCTRMISSWPP